MTAAPMVVKDKVIVGISGGEFGVPGHVTAYNLKDGSKAWRGYSIGPDDQILFDANTTELGKPVGKDSSLKTWQGDQWKIGGGGAWGWYSYDPQLNLIYYGSGNPSTWNPVQRPGDNKWSMTIFARNPDTGIAKWVFQMTPHDEWDYDGVNEMILADINVKGQPVKALVHFDRNGFGYTLNRETGALLVAEKYDPKVNWATHVDMQTGRPEVVRLKPPQRKRVIDMKIKLTNLYVDDQEKALRFYTEKLGFVKKSDFSQGSYRWLTVVSAEEPAGVELVLQPAAFVPPAKAYQQALHQQGTPAAMFFVDDIKKEHERLQGLGVTFTDAADEDRRLDDHHAGRHLRKPGPAHPAGRLVEVAAGRRKAERAKSPIFPRASCRFAARAWPPPLVAEPRAARILVGSGGHDGYFDRPADPRAPRSGAARATTSCSKTSSARCAPDARSNRPWWRDTIARRWSGRRSPTTFGTRAAPSRRCFSTAKRFASSSPRR